MIVVLMWFFAVVLVPNECSSADVEFYPRKPDEVHQIQPAELSWGKSKALKIGGDIESSMIIFIKLLREYYRPKPRKIFLQGGIDKDASLKMSASDSEIFYLTAKENGKFGVHPARFFRPPPFEKVLVYKKKLHVG